MGEMADEHLDRLNQDDDGDERSMSVEVWDVEDCYVKHETEKALLVQLPDLDEVWVPKSQIVSDETELFKVGDRGTLTVTLWIAEQKPELQAQGQARFIGA